MTDKPFIATSIKEALEEMKRKVNRNDNQIIILEKKIECSHDIPKYLGGTSENVKDIYFKPKQKFPITFEGDNFKFKIFSDLTFICSPIFKNNEHTSEFTPKDLEANQKALDKLKELRNENK